MILQLCEEWDMYAVGRIAERLCSELAEGRIAGCLFSTECGNLLRTGKGKHESLGGVHGITAADTARAMRVVLHGSCNMCMASRQT
jgi:hypothetical protein